MLSDRLLWCCRKNLRRVSGCAFCNFSRVGQRSRKSPTMGEPTAENQSSTCGKYIFKQAVRRLIADLLVDELPSSFYQELKSTGLLGIRAQLAQPFSMAH